MKRSKLRIIGLTGPIAAGKNEVCRILSRRAHIIDADQVGHKLLVPQSDLWKELVKTFGSRVLQQGGKVNRKKLGEIVFGNPRLLKKLNKIMHSRMKDEIVKESGKRKAESGKPIIINAAVLREIGLIPIVDEVWVVLADKKKRLNRLVKKGMSREKAERRIKAQKPEKDYLRIADKVIRNDSGKSSLRKLVLSLL